MINRDISYMIFDIFNGSVLKKLTKHNPMIDYFISTIVISFFSLFVKKAYDFYCFGNFNIKNIFFRKNAVILEGRRCTVMFSYDANAVIMDTFSDRFKALWAYIEQNLYENKHIYEIKECLSIVTNFENSKCNRTEKSDIFIVSQATDFLIDSRLNIYVNVIFNNETPENKQGIVNEKKIENIKMTVYSYSSPLYVVKGFIYNITEEYLGKISSYRTNKRFIYSLNGVNYNESILECWKESIFESSRNFSNIFFEEKQNIIQKIDFFINNKSWYLEKGIPYTLGLGLHGPPGTGKSSLIKCISNYLNRHIIILSLKEIKTKHQLETLFFEDRYNDNNKKYSIGFDKKIIVIEDIDCIEIVKNRNGKFKKKEKKEKRHKNLLVIEDKTKDDTTCLLKQTEEPVTLDDILNLWDGIRETQGRIIIITSNHYNQLDPALIRPGRIDISLELGNSSRKIIAEMYKHFFNKTIDKSTLKQIKSHRFSPAEIVNFYINSNNDEDKFIEYLL